MTRLEAINIILRALGETPVTSLDEQYPTLGLALPALDEARKGLLEEEWWFNTYSVYNLLPDANGEIILDDSFLMVYPHKSDKYIFTGSRIVLAKNGSPVVGEPVSAKVVLDAPFEELPRSAQMAITYAAAVNVYAADFGPDDTYQHLFQTALSATEELSAQHTRMRSDAARRGTRAAKHRRMLRL